MPWYLGAPAPPLSQSVHTNCAHLYCGLSLWYFGCLCLAQDSPALGGASQAAADHVAADSSPSSGGAPGSLSPTSSAADVIPARLSEGAKHPLDTGSNRL